MNPGHELESKVLAGYQEILINLFFGTQNICLSTRLFFKKALMMKEHKTQAKSLINAPLFMIFLQQRAPDKFSQC